MKYINYGAAVSEVSLFLTYNIANVTCVILSFYRNIIYDCGQSLNPAVDLGQIEGSFIQGLGFFILEEYETNLDGLVLQDGTWNYKIPTIDTIPQLSSKASGEPPLLLAASVHCATRSAVKEARKQLLSWSNSDDGSDSTFQLGVPAMQPCM
ncbi:abscisic-aldehyde oxidase-like protein [Trifolium pratense]|uniref:Abscisic-aldehyde oxidase-like protein n=1 Tax=Trifolium pratense TaxID=57577 RepID=A0A2K3LU29_TRIPR|nr:abscisic-aldehyde oxidase-like protein [Trifolium pratense]